jgi:hypothetical protein
MAQHWSIALVIAALTTSCARADAAVLITRDEAALPRSQNEGGRATVSPGGRPEDRGGVGRNPDITLEAPRATSTGSPFPLRISFVAHGRSQIDRSTISVKV